MLDPALERVVLETEPVGVEPPLVMSTRPWFLSAGSRDPSLDARPGPRGSGQFSPGSCSGGLAALLGGVTIQVLSPAPVTVKRLTPVMVKGMTRLGRFLRRSRRTRPLVRAIPTIQKRATKMLTNYLVVHRGLADYG